MTDELDAKASLRKAQDNLTKLTGKNINKIYGLGKNIVLPTPEPNHVEAWINQAKESNLQTQSTTLNVSIANKSTVIEHSGYLPSLTTTIQLQCGTDRPPLEDVFYTKRMGLNLNMPIFSGGSVWYKAKQAKYTAKQELSLLEETIDTVVQDVRVSFARLESLKSKAEILNNNITSSEKVVENTIAAFDIGNRDLLDILNAERDLQRARQNYMNAKYDYLIESLKLKHLTGSLSSLDLEKMNQWLTISVS